MPPRVDEVKLRKCIARTAVMSADRIKTPLLLLTGHQDPNVPERTSSEMSYALRRLGQRVEWVSYTKVGTIKYLKASDTLMALLTVCQSMSYGLTEATDRGTLERSGGPRRCTPLRKGGYMHSKRCPVCGMAELIDEGEGPCCPQCLYKPGPRPAAPDVVRFEVPRRKPSRPGKAPRRAA